LFETLAAKLELAIRRIRSRGRLSAADVDEALREVRLALLEADVNFKVVKDFIARVREKAVGEATLTHLMPDQQVIKIVYDELAALMGGQRANLQFSPSPPSSFMLVGLQGAGKTTTAGKLAALLKREGRLPLLAATDVRRPAAIKQLRVIAEKVGAACFDLGENAEPVAVAAAAQRYARGHGLDPVLLDTGGRLHIDDELMSELERMKAAVRPQEVLLVADAMMGQDAVAVARTFHERLGLSGAVLTKLEGDARGGAALSIRAVAGCPIKFVGVGERLEALEPFYPERMASRILGMGDVLTLVERAERAISEDEARALEQKIRADAFTLQDFVDQMKQVRRMGPLDQMVDMVPGLSRLKQKGGLEVDERLLSRFEAIVSSMTPEERARPAIIDGSRRRRIAAGSGTAVQDVNRVLKQYEGARQMLRQMRGGTAFPRKGRV
jgi:signal recognition particle subunit SRP54